MFFIDVKQKSREILRARERRRIESLAVELTTSLNQTYLWFEVSRKIKFRFISAHEHMTSLMKSHLLVFLTSDRASNNTSMWSKQRKAWLSQVMIDQWNVLRRQFNMSFSIVTSSFFLEKTRKIVKLYFYRLVLSFNVKQLYDDLSDWQSSVMKLVRIHVEQLFIFKTY